MKLEVGKIYTNSHGDKVDIISAPSEECEYFTGIIVDTPKIPLTSYCFRQDGSLVSLYDLIEECRETPQQ